MDSLIFRIAVTGIISALLAVVLKKDNPVFAVLIGLAGSILIFFMILPRLGAVIDMLRTIGDSLGSGYAYVSVVLRVIGIAYIAEFGSSICADAGESGLASRVELAGKVLILTTSAPIILTLLRQILTVL